jgi:hypothetical protein
METQGFIDLIRRHGGLIHRIADAGQVAMSKQGLIAAIIPLLARG